MIQSGFIVRPKFPWQYQSLSGSYAILSEVLILSCVVFVYLKPLGVSLECSFPLDSKSLILCPLLHLWKNLSLKERLLDVHQRGPVSEKISGRVNLRVSS